MRSLSLQALKNLKTIINTERFIKCEHLLAVYAYAILATGRKNELRAEHLEAINFQYLSDVYAGDFDTRRANRERLPSVANTALYETQKEMQAQPRENQIDWLFDKVEELAANLDNISNVRLLKAIRSIELAQQEMLSAIEELENQELMDRAEKTAETAKVIGLQPLQGTPKQIEWAERIRKRCLETMSDKELGRGLKSVKASYWIEKYKHVLPRK